MAQNHFNTMLSKLLGNAIIAYTDGSAIGNPGPCGAGAYISLVRKHLPLVYGTNNIGEMFATGMVLQFITNEKVLSRAARRVRTFIFSDSKLTIDSLRKGYGADMAQPMTDGVLAHEATSLPTRDRPPY